MPTADPFYGTQAWKRIRAAVFARDAYRCCDCGGKGKQIGGVLRLTADHAGLPLKEWCRRNGKPPAAYPLLWIVTRCDRCHGRKDGKRGNRG